MSQLGSWSITQSPTIRSVYGARDEWRFELPGILWFGCNCKQWSHTLKRKFVTASIWNLYTRNSLAIRVTRPAVCASSTSVVLLVQSSVRRWSIHEAKQIGVIVLDSTQLRNECHKPCVFFFSSFIQSKFAMMIRINNSQGCQGVVSHSLNPVAVRSSTACT